MAQIEFYKRTNLDESLWDDERGTFVYRQYDGRGELKGRNWYVKVSSPDIFVPHIDNGSSKGPKIPLVGCEYGEQCFVLPETVNLGGLAGELKFYKDVDGKEPLKLGLYIDAANLTQDEVQAIIQRLQQLALQVNSPVSTNSYLAVTEEWAHGLYQPLIEKTQEFLKLCQIVQQQWPFIVKTPARDMRLLRQVVDVSSSSKPLSGSLVQKVCQRPDARRVEALYPAETSDTLENRYLAFVVESIVKDKNSFVSKLECCKKQIEQKWKKRQNQDKDVLPRENIRQENEAQERKIVCHLRELTDELAGAIKQIRGYQQSALLQNIQPRLPLHLSDRLKQSQEYAPVYKAFSKYQTEREKLFVPLRKGLDRALNRMYLRPTWQLYELWLLIEAYDTLVNRFGFQPADGEQGSKHPLQHLDAVDDELIEVSLEGAKYNLRFEIPGVRIDACLRYNCEVHQNGEVRRPDLHLCFNYNSVSYHFILDAKYRNYEQQGADVFRKDVIETAKDKYLKKLTFDSEKPCASFIIRSDIGSKRNNNYWGGDYHDWLGQEELPNHQYGAVCVTPSDIQNIDRMLECFLMYHMGIHNVCWTCRQKIEPVQEPGIVGDVYECAPCSVRWIDTWCGNEYCRNSTQASKFIEARNMPNGTRRIRNTILKFSTDTDVDTFHKRVDAGNQWWYLCPHCGSGGQKK